MLIRRLFLIGVICICSFASAQVRACWVSHHELPDDLRSSLEKRLSTFLAAEAEGRWDEVAELIGECSRCAGGSLYTDLYKRCLLSRMQEIRMVDLDFSIHDLTTCTMTELPAGPMTRVAAEQLKWYVGGTGSFQTSSERWTEQTQVVAYRDNGQWYFIPPQQHMQEKWEKIHYTEADFARDYRQELEVRNSPSSPLEITNLHAYMDRKFPSIRNVRFKLHNRTSKKVVGLRAEITMINGRGAIDFGGPFEIEAKGEMALEQSASAYGDFCRGIDKQALFVEEVDFADGSKWKSEEQAKSE